MRMRSLALAVLLAGSCLLATGCGAGDGEVLHSGDSLVLVGAEGDGDNIAGFGFGGRVAMVGDCLGIKDATVIWPHGTELASVDPVVVDVAGLGRVRVGDKVTGGAARYVEYLPDGIDAIPSACPSTFVVGFFPE